MAKKDSTSLMEKETDFILVNLPDLEIPEPEDTLTLPIQDTYTDEVSQSAETKQFCTEEILTIIEQTVSEGPKHRKRNRVKDVFKDK